jgi:hypothetical protein
VPSDSRSPHRSRAVASAQPSTRQRCGTSRSCASPTSTRGSGSTCATRRRTTSRSACSTTPPEAYLRASVAERLKRAQDDLERDGVYLVVYDAYRPWSVQWTLWSVVADPDYVADPRKGSRHNRGAAVDVGLVDRDGNPLPMPSAYDEFTPRAHRDYAGASPQERTNRERLERALYAQGFTRPRDRVVAFRRSALGVVPDRRRVSARVVHSPLTEPLPSWPRVQAYFSRWNRGAPSRVLRIRAERKDCHASDGHFQQGCAPIARILERASARRGHGCVVLHVRRDGSGGRRARRQCGQWRPGPRWRNGARALRTRGRAGAAFCGRHGRPGRRGRHVHPHDGAGARPGRNRHVDEPARDAALQHGVASPGGHARSGQEPRPSVELDDRLPAQGRRRVLDREGPGVRRVEPLRRSGAPDPRG